MKDHKVEITMRECARRRAEGGPMGAGRGRSARPMDARQGRTRRREWGEWRSLYALASVVSQLLGYVGHRRYRFAARRPPRSALTASKFPPVYDR